MRSLYGLAPVYLAVTGFYSMNAFEPALWCAAALVVARIVNGGDARLWLLLGGLLGLSLLNKISTLWFGFGLGVGLLLTPQRRCVAALLANQTGRAVKFRMDRDTDMIVTGKRHDFIIDYDVGFDKDGRINAVELTYASRCGMSADLSGAINDRTMFHSDNAYFLENATIVSHRCKTHTVSNTAFRGFGGPQGMFGIEYVVDEIARYLKVDPLDVRKQNFYGIDDRNVTPYKQKIEDNIIHELTDQLEKSSDYRARREEIRAWNTNSEILKRGIALTPVKFGISLQRHT